MPRNLTPAVPPPEARYSPIVFADWWHNHFPIVDSDHALPSQRHDPRRCVRVCYCCNREVGEACEMDPYYCPECGRIIDEQIREEVQWVNDGNPEEQYCICDCLCVTEADSRSDSDSDPDWEPDQAWTDGEEPEDHCLDTARLCRTAEMHERSDYRDHEGAISHGSGVVHPLCDAQQTYYNESLGHVLAATLHDISQVDESSFVNSANQISDEETNNLYRPMVAMPQRHEGDTRPQLRPVNFFELGAMRNRHPQLTDQEIRHRFPELWHDILPPHALRPPLQPLCPNCALPYTTILRRALRRKILKMCSHCDNPYKGSEWNDFAVDPDFEIGESEYCNCSCGCMRTHPLAFNYGEGSLNTTPEETPVARSFNPSVMQRLQQGEELPIRVTPWLNVSPLQYVAEVLLEEEDEIMREVAAVEEAGLYSEYRPDMSRLSDNSLYTWVEPPQRRPVARPNQRGRPRFLYQTLEAQPRTPQ